MRKTMKLLGAALTMAGATVLLGGTAGAAHGHFVVIENPATGEVTCQYIAEGQTSISDPAAGGYHQFHDHVHLGQPAADDNGTDVDKASNQGLYDCSVVRG